MNLDLQGAIDDLVPLAAQIWAWAAGHYLELMTFALALAFIIGWSRRKR